MAWCARFVAARPSNVTRLARLLSAERRALFFPAYAAMRVIDDEVDEVFLALDEEARHARRTAMLSRIETWRDAAGRAACGRYAAPGDGADALVFTAMNATIGRGELGREPFDGLADALRRDVAERPLVTWRDFLDYCEGAAVAPAAVFAYIVACRPRDDGGTSCELARPCADYVRNLAIFSYLVHILRDLRRDAERAPQHLTLPDDLLASVGLDKGALKEAALRGNDAALAPLVGPVAELAERFRLATLDDLATLNRETGDAATMLVGLAEVYRSQLAAIRGDYGAVLGGAAVVDMATVDRLLAAGYSAA